jgi:hypothetical protein
MQRPDFLWSTKECALGVATAIQAKGYALLARKAAAARL